MILDKSDNAKKKHFGANHFMISKAVAYKKFTLAKAFLYIDFVISVLLVFVCNGNLQSDGYWRICYLIWP